jgi:Na+/proline symporter
MAIAGYLVVSDLPEGMGFSDALYVAGQSGKLNVITTEFNWKDKYNIWSGVIGGFFLALSYFGTDNSQVGRYLTAKDTKESRLGLLFNGLVKVPMQFAILLIGALLFSFYSFYQAPLNFNESALKKLKVAMPAEVSLIEKDYNKLHTNYEQQAITLANNKQTNTPASVSGFLTTQNEMNILRDSTQRLIAKHISTTDANDTNYIFLHFVKHSLPVGLVGLLFAVIFLASWGSISAALNSLAASSLMDVQLLTHKIPPGEDRQLWLGRMHTLGWGVFCIGVAMFASRMGSLIEAVNILGSLFYGTILGIFLVAFYVKKAKGNLVFGAAVITELCVVLIYLADVVSFLWLNAIGALLVVLICLTGTLTKSKTADQV